MDLKKIALQLAGSTGSVRTAGEVTFRKDQGPLQRDIRANGFEWSQDSLYDLAKILWACQRSHSYAMAAYRLFSKMPSSRISPDGLLGGRGYIQNIKEMRGELAKSVETLSSFTDTLHDEINADHWKSSTDENVTQMVSDAEGVKENPEEFVEDSYEGDGSFDDTDVDSLNPSAEDMNPEASSVESSKNDEEESNNEGEEENEENGEDEETDSEEDEDEDEENNETSDEDEESARLSSDLSSKKPRISSNLRTAGGWDETEFLPGVHFEPVIEDRVNNSDSVLNPNGWGPRAFPYGPYEGKDEDGSFKDYDQREDTRSGDNSYTFNDPDPILDNGLFLHLPIDDKPMEGETLRRSSRIAATTYSWLPGSDNSKQMNYYAQGISKSDLDWMKVNNKPDIPKGILPGGDKINPSDFWLGVKI